MPFDVDVHIAAGAWSELAISKLQKVTGILIEQGSCEKGKDPDDYVHFYCDAVKTESLKVRIKDISFCLAYESGK